VAHPLFGPEIRMMLLDNNNVGLKAFVETLNPTTTAETLSEDEFSVEQVWQVLSQAEPRKAAVVFEYFPPDWQVELAAGTGRPQMARLIELMSHDDRVDLLRRLPSQVSSDLLRLVDEADRRDIASLFRYTENSVGAIMTTAYAWLPANLTTGGAIERLRLQAPDKETIYYVYVLDEASRRMLGIVSLRSIVLSAPNTPLRDVTLKSDIVSLKATDDRERAAETLVKYDLLAIPVLDDDGRLVGIVTHDDIVDVINQEATEDIQRQAAVGPMRESYLEVSLGKLWYSRGRWLALLFALQMFTINAMAHYDDQLKVLLLLSAFVPVCLSVGGNSGSQAAALVTRGLALGQVSTRDWFKVLRRELIVGVALGVTIGIMGLARTWLFTSPDDLKPATLEMFSLTIAISVSLTCLMGTLVGSLLPLAVAKIGGDPAIASVPFIATMSDVLGIVIYFNVAFLLLLQ
jgi:magnesium transporter